MKRYILSALCLASSMMVAQEMLTATTTNVTPVQNPTKDPCSQAVETTQIDNGGFFGGETNQRLAIDIDVDSDTAFEIETVTIYATDDGTTFDLIFYDDDAGLPGSEITSVSGVSITSQTNYGSAFDLDWDEYVLDVSGEGIVLQGAAKYWMEVVSDATAWESTQAQFIDQPGAFANDNTAGDWSLGTSEYVYVIDGDCTGSVSVDNVLLSEVNVFPNPATDVINVSVPAEVEIAGAVLYDILGKETGVSIDNGTMNIGHLAKGVYILSMETTAGSLTRKIIKK